MSTSQSSGLATTSVPYGGRKSKSKIRKALPASVRPSARPPAELPPSTTSRNASATCALSSRVLEREHQPRSTPSSDPNQTTTARRTAARESPLRSLVQLEPIAHRRLGPDELRAHGIELELPAELADVHAQILLRVAHRVAPHRVEELRVRQRPARRCATNARSSPHSVGVRWTSSPRRFTTRCRQVDRRRADRDEHRRAAAGRVAARRSCARTRAVSSTVLNGLVT